jgi:hypothetical protein
LGTIRGNIVVFDPEKSIIGSSLFPKLIPLSSFCNISPLVPEIMDVHSEDCPILGRANGAGTDNFRNQSDFWFRSTPNMCLTTYVFEDIMIS